MPYRLILKPGAEDDLKRLDRIQATRIVKKLQWLAQNAPLIQHEPMKGNWGGFYRYRVGDYRIIYSLLHTEALIVIEVIGHRSDVYDE
jgi:mRNA interferase RelE/StbE